MADDQQQTNPVQIALPDQSSPSSEEQVTTETTLPPDTQRPISSELTDETQSMSQPSFQDLADQQQVSSSPVVQRPDSSVLADEKPADERPSKPQPQDQRSESPTPIAEVDKMADEPPITPVSNLSNLNDNISISPPDQQAPQVQSEAPSDASKIDAAKQEDPSASFKSEPPEQPQIAPLADLPAEVSTKEGNNSQISSQKRFGDLLSETDLPPTPQSPLPSPPTPPIPSTPPISPAPSPSSPISFGDLIKDIEITPPSIPEAERPVEQPQSPPPSQTSTPQPTSPTSPSSLVSTVSPSDNSQPTTDNPQPSSPSPQSVQSDQLVQETKVIEKIVEKPVEVIKEVVKEVPVVDQEEVKKQIAERLKLEQTQRRQLAQQAKTQRITKNLEKIVELAKTKEFITNIDVRELLHVSQSAATNYLSQLVKEGRLKREGKSKYIRYHL